MKYFSLWHFLLIDLLLLDLNRDSLSIRRYRIVLLQYSDSCSEIANTLLEGDGMAFFGLSACASSAAAHVRRTLPITKEPYVEAGSTICAGVHCALSLSPLNWISSIGN